MPMAAYILFRNPAEGPRRRIGTHLVEPQDYIISLKFSETLVTRYSQDRLRSIHFRKAAWLSIIWLYKIRGSHVLFKV